MLSCSIIYYTPTCSEYAKMHTTQNPHIYDENIDVLGKYLTDDQIFHLLITTGIVISGSTTLQSFESVVYLESDRDLYMEHRYNSPIALWWVSIRALSCSSWYQFRNIRIVIVVLIPYRCNLRWKKLWHRTFPS